MRDASHRLVIPALAALAALATFSVAGCGTIAGAGEDLSKAGDAVTDTAEDVEDDLENN